MTLGRQYAGAVKMNRDQLWISGGYFMNHNGKKIASLTSELYSSRHNSFQPHFHLPEAMAHHHMLKINHTHVLLAATSKRLCTFYGATTFASLTEVPSAKTLIF